MTLYSPMEGSLGVESSLKAWIAPASSMTTPSVKVPPISTPMRNFMSPKNIGWSHPCQQDRLDGLDGSRRPPGPPRGPLDGPATLGDPEQRLTFGHAVAF